MAHRSTPALALALALACAPAHGQPPAPAPQAEPAAPEITVTGRNPALGPPLVGPAEFISPMGEPFRSEDKLSGAEHWFIHADANGDGRLTRAEFLADALKFFQTLDTDHDDVIGPNELQYYETEVAPEVTVTSTYGDVSKITTDSDGKLVDPPYPTRLGAGRYGYLAAPEPIASADLNLDRGTTRQEFLQVAAARFKLLDTNGDGAIVRAELPKLNSPHEFR